MFAQFSLSLNLKVNTAKFEPQKMYVRNKTTKSSKRAFHIREYGLNRSNLLYLCVRLIGSPIFWSLMDRRYWHFWYVDDDKIALFSLHFQSLSYYEYHFYLRMLSEQIVIELSIQ